MRILAYNQLPSTLRRQLEHGATNAVCPMCQGGRSGEASLSIQAKDMAGTLSLKCFRASCGWYCLTNPGGLEVRPRQAGFQPKPLEAATYDLDDSTLGYLISSYGLDGPVLLARGWRQLSTKHISIPLLDRHGLQLGHQTRTLTTPKIVRTYKTVDRPLLDVWTCLPGSTTIVVEDSISAARLFCLGYNAVSILGTNISVEQAKEIRLTAGDQPVILALDRDAFHKALDHSQRLRHIVDFRPVCLDEDIKDVVSDIDLISFIDGVTRGRTKANSGDSPRQEQL